MKRSHRTITLLALLLGLLLAACAPTMGGATTSEVAGTLQATYQADADEVFAAVQQHLSQVPGWSVAANDATNRYMRVEQSAMQARLFAAPVTVTDFVAATVMLDGDGVIVAVDHVAKGTDVAQGLIAALNLRFQ